MSKVSDKDLAAGLRSRKKPDELEAEVRSSTVLGRMMADALRIPLSSIQTSPYQVRQLDDTVVEDLMSSIVDTDGIISPVIVRPLPDGMYELVAGHTRLEACKRLGHPDIQAIVRPLSDAEAGRALAADNLARKDLCDYEIHKQLKVLFSNNFLKSNSEAARLLGRTRQDIIRYNSFGKLPPSVIDLLESNKSLIGGTTAVELGGFPESTVVEGCQKLLSGQLKTQQDLLAWLRKPKTTSPPRSESRVLNDAGKTVGKIARGTQALKISGKIPWIN